METPEKSRKRILPVEGDSGEPEGDKVPPVTIQKASPDMDVIDLSSGEAQETAKRSKVAADNMSSSEDDAVNHVEDPDLEIVEEVIHVPQATPAAAVDIETGQFSASASNRQVEIFIKACDSNTGRLLVRPLRFPSKMSHLASFMKRHNFILRLNGTGDYSVVCRGQPPSFPGTPNMFRPNILRPPTPTVATRYAGNGGRAFGGSRNTSPSHSNAAQRESIPATEIEETSSKAPEQGPIANENPQNDLLAAVGLTLKNSTALKPGIPCTTTSANEAESSTPDSSQNNGSNSSEAAGGDDCPAPSKEERRPLRSSFRNTVKAKESEAPVNVAALEKRETSWGLVAPMGLVFARWDDDWFYSAKVKCPGELSNWWVIVFDDGVEYTAYTSDILPVSILGEGAIVNYPADSVRPRDATIIGQQVEWNAAAKSFSVKYALILQGQNEPIWATRSELCFAETTATRLQIQFELAEQAKAEADNSSTSNGRKTRGGNKKK